MSWRKQNLSSQISCVAQKASNIFLSYNLRPKSLPTKSNSFRFRFKHNKWINEIYCQCYCCFFSTQISDQAEKSIQLRLGEDKMLRRETNSCVIGKCPAVREAWSPEMLEYFVSGNRKWNFSGRSSYFVVIIAESNLIAWRILQSTILYEGVWWVLKSKEQK